MKIPTMNHDGKAEREVTGGWHLASLKIVRPPAELHAGHPLIQSTTIRFPSALFTLNPVLGQDAFFIRT